MRASGDVKGASKRSPLGSFELRRIRRRTARRGEERRRGRSPKIMDGLGNVFALRIVIRRYGDT